MAGSSFPVKLIYCEAIVAHNGENTKKKRRHERRMYVLYQISSKNRILKKNIKDIKLLFDLESEAIYSSILPIISKYRYKFIVIRSNEKSEQCNLGT